MLVEDVGLNQLDGGEFVEMENKTAEGKLAGVGGVCVEGRVLQQKEYDDPEKEQRKRW